MRIIITFLILFASLATVSSFYIQPQQDNNLPELNNLSFSHPLVLIVIGLIVSISILIFTILLLARPTRSDLHRSYKNIDSETLDEQEHICVDFYDKAYKYRCKFGSNSYQKNVVQKFQFQYRFHNDALKWIDEIANRTALSPPSAQFITSAISSGHIGQVFTELNYVGGLEEMHIKPGSHLFAYMRSDSLEIWTNSSDIPVSILSNKNLELRRANKKASILSGTLTGEKRFGQECISIELSFPEYQYNHETGLLEDHEVFATQNYQRFKEWLTESEQKLLTLQQSNFGIAISDEEYIYDNNQSGRINAASEMKPFTGNNRLIKKLENLAGKQVDAFFDRGKMAIVKAKSPLDVVVLCSNLGLVTITEKTATGAISYNGDAGWLVYNNQRSHIIPNTCMAAERARKSLVSLLKHHNLYNWPVFSLVIFSGTGVELNRISGKQRIQCDVIKLDELTTWFTANKNNPKVRFTKDDYNILALLFGKKLGKYREKLQEYAQV